MISLKGVIAESLALLLKPVVVLCLRHSIKLDQVVSVLKVLFVEAAQEEIGRLGDLPSASRISAMTGVHRKDSSKLVARKPEQVEEKNLIARVVGLWQHHPKYRNKGGKPRALDVEGKASEFVELVLKVSSDLNPYTVLYELERVKAVTRRAGKVKLSAGIYLPKGNYKQGLKVLGQDLADLICSVEENITSKKPPHLHLRTEYDNIPEEDAPKVREWLMNEGTAFHEKARGFFSRFDRDSSARKADSGGTVRVAFGSFGRVEVLNKRKI